MRQAWKARFFLAWSIWTSFLIGPVLLLLLARFQQERLGGSLQADFPVLWLRTVAYLITIILFPLIGALKRLIERNNARVAAAVHPTEKSLVSGSYFAGLVLALALAESIAILGFVLFLFGDNLQTLYIFLGLSGLAMLLHRPAAGLTD